MKSTATTNEHRAMNLRVGRDAVTVDLTDGRVVSVPLAFYPSLLTATAAQRRNWQMIGDGEGFDWPDLDLQLSTRGFVEGIPEKVFPAEVRRKWQQDARDLAKQRCQTRRPQSEQQA